MKLAISVSFALIIGVAACSHHQQPQTARTAPSTEPATTPMQTALVAPAPEPQLAPGAATIPRDPQVAPPQAPALKTADSPVTTSNFASARPESLPSVPTDSKRDQSETSADEESVREIRALLAADKSLSPTARQVTVTATKGRVRLTGQVNTAEERAAVERAARKAANVIDVRNQLVVLQ
jgi:hypothetical protein